jgi:Tol biopolymer transport system component
MGLRCVFGGGVMAALLAGSALAAGAPEVTVFAPGVISGPANDDAPAFTADGRTVVFGSGPGTNSTLLISHRTKSGWSAPAVAPFSGEWNDQQPAMAPDGSFLVFVSSRPLATGDKTRPSGHLWRVDQVGKGWGTPVHLPAAVNASTNVYAPSVAGDGSLYFIRREGDKEPFHIWRSQYRDGQYLAATPVTFGVTGNQEVDPAVAPDESFLVFAAAKAGSDAPERLYIAFRTANAWGKPVDLGDKVNIGTTNSARLGPDHRTLYFTSDRVTPVKFPRTRAKAVADLARTRSWDNGATNIFSVPLAPWLDKPAGA